MQLRYLEEVTLKKATKTKQSNGAYINTYTKVNDYNVQLEELTDATSASIYGATINKMYRISSPMRLLENYLKPKLNDKQDNLSIYYIEYNNGLYKITAVRQNWIDIEYIEGVEVVENTNNNENNASDENNDSDENDETVENDNL